LQSFIGDLAGEFVIFSISSALFQFSRLLVNAMVARQVGPERFGTWNTLNLLLFYGAAITLGIPHGMSRNVPLLMGKGEKARARKVMRASFWFTLFPVFFAGVIVGLISLFVDRSKELRMSLVWMGMLFPTWMIYQQHFVRRLKCRIKFRLVSIQQVMFALLLPLIALPFSYHLGIPGFVVGQTIVSIIVICFIGLVSSFDFSFGWDLQNFTWLLRTGFPILSVGFLYRVLTSIDQWVVLNFLGRDFLGHYSPAIWCLGALRLLPAVIAQQMYPRMAFQYGVEADRKSVWAMAIKQSLLTACITIPLLVLLYILLPPLIYQFLPEYELGIRPARILLVGLIFVSISGGLGSFFNVVNKQGHYIVVQIGAILISFFLELFFINKGLGLTGVALGASLSYLLYSIALLGTGFAVAHQEKGRIE
jgi:O-antigen/teichoic acid export membrane protein